MPSDVTPYDALLLVSFGGPEKPGDVVPFLENVTRGRGVPRERLEAVAEHYLQFGGRSPINDLNREFLEELREDFKGSGIDLPIYWGNRNWDPYLTDTVRAMRDDGVTRAACFTTSAYSSYSSCRQYREDLADATMAVEGAPKLEKLRGYFNHPGFVEPMVDATLGALAGLPAQVREDAHLSIRDPLHPRRHERLQRRIGWGGVRLAAPQRDGGDRGPHPPGDRTPARPRTRLLLPLGAAAGAVAGARHQRPPQNADLPGGGRGADRVRLRPHGGGLRPRHRGRGDCRRARPAVRACGDGRHRPTVRHSGA